MTLILSGTDGLSDVDGSAATPAIRGTDTNTGIFFPAADTIAFSEGGTEAMRIDSSGNVGIGTNSPGYKLDVNGTGRVTTEVRIKNTAGNVSYLTFEENGNGNSATFISGDARTTGNIGFWTNSTERLRLDSSGNVGLGVTPSAWGTTKALEFSYGSFSANSSIGTDVAGNCYYNGTNWIYRVTGVALRYNQATAGHSWHVASGTAGNAISFTQAMTLDSSGNLLVGTTTGAARVYVKADGAIVDPVTVNNTNTTANSQYAILFVRNSSTVGSIQTTNSATSYNTSSDYRLKENIAPMTGALATVAALKPCTYTWKVDGSAGQGFIAHELAEVVPDCVTGEKDAVDANGNPVYQGIDTSFLVATLTAAIQEQQAIIQSLTARIEALEGK